MTNTLTFFNKINLLRQRYYQALTGKEALIQLINEAEVSEHVHSLCRKSRLES